MPATPEIPDDLLQLQIAFEAADRAVHDHVAAVDADRDRPWSEEEHATLERLRGERMVALKALTSHPAILAERTGSCTTR